MEIIYELSKCKVNLRYISEQGLYFV